MTSYSALNHWLLKQQKGLWADRLVELTNEVSAYLYVF